MRHAQRLPKPAAIGIAWTAWLFLGIAPAPSLAQELTEAQKLFRQGQYTQCLETIKKATDRGWVPKPWHQLKIQTLLVLGKNAEAVKAADEAVRAQPLSVELLMLSHEALRGSGLGERADQTLQRINGIGSAYRIEYWDPPELVALGEAALAMGHEPSRVLQDFYSRALRNDPECREAHLAAGRLALNKHDDALAAKHFTKGLSQNRSDPDFEFGLAKSKFESNRPEALSHLKKVLENNPHHIPSLLLLADHQIDAEAETEAETNLAKILKVNALHPEAWAYRAVLAHLKSNPKGYAEARSKALSTWPANPAVDHLIGRKLSGKYRFAEGAAHQRQALKYDPKHLPSKMQLSLDLLRLGREQEGWRLADEVQTQDGYNVVAFNLVTLRDHLRQFKTLETDGFLVRMDQTEADIYGDRVLKLLVEARTVLAKKYGLKTTERCVVEIFPEQQDFAVRTFGVPGGAGYLGVCFGNVITANSPASIAARASNWQAVLWHEYAHVVTLNLTKNKMPRWLSEGISVYEERQRHRAWGERMNGRYRHMILTGELTPVGQLSGAFLSPKSGLHLQFAYYESSLVVEYLIEQYGLKSIRAILTDLAKGIPINQALANHTTKLETLEKAFEVYAIRRAGAMAPKLDWTEPDDPRQFATDESIAEWLAEHPDNYWGLIAKARRFMAEKAWAQAVPLLKRLIELHPTQSAPGNAYTLLGRAYHKLEKHEDERKTLEKLAAISPNAMVEYGRLAEMAQARQDWPQARLHAERTLAVDPMSSDAWRHLARSSEMVGAKPTAIEAYQTLLKLHVPDRVRVHFHLAQLLKIQDPAAARRHVLRALEEAPRFRKAQKLLMELRQPKGDAS